MRDAASVRGAADLVRCWAELEVGVAEWPMPQLPPGLALGALSNTLRSRAWRDHCASALGCPGMGCCVDVGTPCRGTASDRCTGDTLFPVSVGRGVPAWRMATVFLHWHAHAGILRLLLLGPVSADQLDWACATLSQRHGLAAPLRRRRVQLGELFLPVARRWRLAVVTPWVAAKVSASAPIADDGAPDAAALKRELITAMTSRAHKLTALSCRDMTAQRLGGHLAHHVAEQLLPGAVHIQRADLQSCLLPAESAGNGHRFAMLAWVGQADLLVHSEALPWLSLLNLCGGGAQSDKGFGAVELIPV